MLVQGGMKPNRLLTVLLLAAGMHSRASAQGSGVTLPLINVSLLGSTSGSQCSTPVQGPDGFLYGVTSLGGPNNAGVLFKASLDGKSVVQLHAFAGLGLLGTNNGGANPKGALLYGPDGNLYGVCQNGGANGAGAIYRIAPDGSGFTALHAFAGALLGVNAGGANPTAALALGPDGKLYGVCPNGGTSGAGTLFRLGLDGSGFTALHNFTGGADGAHPVAEVTIGANGALYGTARAGGASGLGVVYRALADGSLVALHSFNGPDGSHPLASVTIGHDGNLYGVTNDGGAANLGVAFAVAPDGSAFTPLASFSATTGGNPTATLTAGADGDLLGTTTSGGANGAGSVVQLSADGDLAPLYSFPAGDSSPSGLSVDVGGLLHAGVDVGNVGSLLSVAFPPVITSPLTINGLLGQPFSYQITASGVPTLFSATGLPAGLSIDSTSGLITGTPSSAGAATVTIGASNLLGTDAKPLVVTILPQGPGLTITALAGGQVGVPYSFQVTANGNPTSFTATGLPSGLTINPTTGLILGTPTQAGNATVTITATGAGGLSTGTFTLPVLPAVPVITSAAGVNVQIGTPLTYQITATGNPAAFTATGLPAGLSVDATTGLITGTPTQLGVFPISVTAANAGGTGTGTVGLSVTTEPSTAPIIESPASVSAQIGVPFSYQILASGDPTSFGASGLPGGLGIDAATGLISGVPTQAGNFTVTISASSAQGTGTASLTTAISGTTPLPAAPAITSPTEAAAQLGAAFNYQITATNSPTSYGATGLPEGLSVNAGTGAITGTPTRAGEFSFVISASNAGGTGESTVSTQVTSELPVITITPASDTVSPGQIGKFVLTRTGDTSSLLLVAYRIRGNALANVDYVNRKTSGFKKFKPGHATANIGFDPIGAPGDANRKKVKLVLEPGANYTLGAQAKAKMFIEP